MKNTKGRIPSIRFFIQVAVMYVIALFILHVWQRVLIGQVFLILSSLVLICGILFPAFHKTLDKIGNYITIGVSKAMSWILLVPCYFIFFIPARIMIKLRGTDPMKLKYPSGEKSFWVDKSYDSTEHYRRQF